MSGSVDLYNASYSNYEADVYRQVRIETYGEDLGQTSWVTPDESREVPKLLGLTSDAFVLEIGCGSGARLDPQDAADDRLGESESPDSAVSEI